MTPLAIVLVSLAALFCGLVLGVALGYWLGKNLNTMNFF